MSKDDPRDKEIQIYLYVSYASRKPAGVYKLIKRLTSALVNSFCILSTEESI